MSGTEWIIPDLVFFTITSSEKSPSPGGRLVPSTSASCSASDSTSSQPDVEEADSEDVTTSISSLVLPLCTSMQSSSFFGWTCQESRRKDNQTNPVPSSPLKSNHVQTAKIEPLGCPDRKSTLFPDCHISCRVIRSVQACRTARPARVQIKADL